MLSTYKYFGYKYMYNIGENYLLTYSMDISCYVILVLPLYK